jgi:voltage-gated potassium channel
VNHDIAAAGAARVGRAVVVSAVRTVVILTVVLLFYYRAPLDRPLNGWTAVLFAAVPVLLVMAVALAVRNIIRSPRPRLQALHALSVGVPMLLVVFASIYCIVDAGQRDAFSERLSRSDGLYFTVTVFATVGFGDITAVSDLARILVTVQMVLGLLTVGVIAKLLFGAADFARARRSRATSDDRPG